VAAPRDPHGSIVSSNARRSCSVLFVRPITGLMAAFTCGSEVIEPEGVGDCSAAEPISSANQGEDAIRIGQMPTAKNLVLRRS
jgi:hypothetical protein